MQSLQLILTGPVILVLLAATSLAVVAQDEATMQVSVAPVVVTGTLDCTDGESEEPMGQSVVTVHAWQATDPRLSGEATYTGHWHIYEPPSEDAGDPEAVDVADAAVYEIVTEGGGWLCESSRTAPPRTGDATHTLVFSGKDEYEGLTAYLHVDWSATPFTFSGLIMEGEAPAWAPPAE